MKEIDFNPSTMTRATQEDIERIYFELWGIELQKEDSMAQFKIRYALGNSDDFQRTVITAKDEADVRAMFSDCTIYEIEEIEQDDECNCPAQHAYMTYVPHSKSCPANKSINPITEAQQIERTIDATIHAEDLGTRMIISGGDVLELGAQTGSCEDIF